MQLNSKYLLKYVAISLLDLFHKTRIEIFPFLRIQRASIKKFDMKYCILFVMILLVSVVLPHLAIITNEIQFHMNVPT